MVTVRGRKKSLAPRMMPPRVVRTRTESESEEELLEEADSNASTGANEATFIQARGSENDSGDGDAIPEGSNGGKVIGRDAVEPKVTRTPSLELKKAVPATTAKPSMPVQPSKPSKTDLDTTNGSTDSGHSELMDTTVQPVDDVIPGYHAAVSLMEEAVRTSFPVTARPPCTVDAEMVSNLSY